MKKRAATKESLPSETELLPGELIDLAGIDAKPTATDEELNLRYVKGEIRIVSETARYSLVGILAMLQGTIDPGDGRDPEPRYQLDPEYQRRHRWSIERKSRLIESFLMNVPVPPVFLYEKDLARFEVMDGRQRLTAIREFYDDKFELKGLQYWPELNGRTYSKLPSKVRDGIDRRYISSIILLKETAPSEEKAAQMKKLVFERLNSGGVALSHQETRNAVYDGPLNRLCLELSANSDFRSMWRIPQEIPFETEDDDESEEREEPTKMGRLMFEKMEDVELVLRFFAYRQLHSFPSGLNKISEFLDHFLIEGNKFSEKILISYKEMFEGTISLLLKLLGNQAFCRMNRVGKPSGRPTKIVYDPLMYIASRYPETKAGELLLSDKGVLVGELKKMYELHGDLFAGRRTNPSHVPQRNGHVEIAFKSALGKLEK